VKNIDLPQEIQRAIAKQAEAALQLQFLQTLTEIAAEKNSTAIFPVPIDLLSMFMEKRQR
jgi:hypothetical protein